MPHNPNITVQLVHIHGPLKGQIQDFSEFPITIGRHSSCEVRFAKDLSTISRRHARIDRQENRFRIVDVSTNGTFVNGKRIADVYLRDGDVITFSEDGPKASFLTKIETVFDALSSSNTVDPSQPSFTEPGLTVGPDKEIEVLNASAPLMIQHGATLQSYNQLPIIIGSDSSCDFFIDSEDIAERHVQIFFDAGNYHVKDLTGKSQVTINKRAVVGHAVLAQGAELSLSGKGPRFKFLGGGRLAEMP